MKQNRLLRKLHTVPAPPCERGCSNYHKCATEQLACGKFYKYAKLKGPMENHWQPSREIFNQIFVVTR